MQSYKRKMKKYYFAIKIAQDFYANIVQAVKKCYKRKIDFRVFNWRFLVVGQRQSSCFSSFKASLHCKRTTFGVQRSPNCIAKGLQLQCNSCPFEVKRSFFLKQKLAPQSHHRHNSLGINDITKTAQNSRILNQRFRCAFRWQF